jgi:hypothetical protein
MQEMCRRHTQHRPQLTFWILCQELDSVCWIFNEVEDSLTVLCVACSAVSVETVNGRQWYRCMQNCKNNFGKWFNPPWNIAFHSYVIFYYHSYSIYRMYLGGLGLNVCRNIRLWSVRNRLPWDCSECLIYSVWAHKVGENLAWISLREE